MRKNMITIEFLTDHLDTIPTLTKWFRAQWGNYYANWSDEEMTKDFLEDVSRNSPPPGLLLLIRMRLSAQLSCGKARGKHYWNTNLN